MKSFILFLVAACALTHATSIAHSAGFPITESKEELGLKYELSAEASGDDDIVLVTLRISDLGKLKPLDNVVLEFQEPSKPGKQATGLNAFPLATKEVDGKLVAWCQLNRKLAEQASIHLVPKKPPDGHVVFGWVFYSIPLRNEIKERPRAAAQKSDADQTTND